MDPNPDPRLEEAMRRSPELAAMLGERRGDPLRRYRRLALMVGALGVAVLVLWLAARSIGGWRRRDEPATEIDRSVYLPPIKTERLASGEETSPFVGFALSIDTEPPGAVISIGGKVRGEAPVLANVECRGTETLKVVARKEGFRPMQRELKCRADELVKLKLVLER